jgi:hypothetical protein
MIQLYYTPSTGSLSSSLQVIADNQTPVYYTGITISSSSVSIFVQSGSTSLATYPISNTTLYYPPFPTITPSNANTVTTATSASIVIQYQFDVNYTNGISLNLSGSGYSLTSGSNTYLTGSYYSNIGNTVAILPIADSYTFTATAYGSTGAGATYSSSLFILSNQGIPPTNIVALVTGSNVSSSATFTLSPTASYTMYFEITGISYP